MTEALPFVDEHSRLIEADPAAVWRAVLAVALPMTRGTLPAPLAALWRPEPARGFGVAVERPGELLSLRGRHRFSRYQLDFVLSAEGEGRTRLRAVTRAVFPGPHGRVYRAAVIGTRAHVVVTRGMLRRIARRAAPADR